MESIICNEIGSEFFSTIITSEKQFSFPANTMWYLSGRSALRAIIQQNSFHTVSLPSWCCDSMIKPFYDANIQVSFYSVNGMEQDLSGIDSDAVLVMDYFGFNGYSKVPKNYNGVVIRDLTHSLFSGYYNDADYYFGSIRKWTGVYTGGFAWGKNNDLPEPINNCDEVIRLRKIAMEQKAKYLNGERNDKGYLSLFSQAEELLDEELSVCMPFWDEIDKIKYFDYDRMKCQRRKNALLLMEKLEPYCLFKELKPDDCPLFVPIITTHREELRRSLIANQIYCPVHWPLSRYHQITEPDKDIYSTELSLVCDQRYGIEEMDRLAESVQEVLNRVESI